jgi:hypothetical protein
MAGDPKPCVRPFNRVDPSRMLYGKSFHIYRERAVSSTPTNLRVTRTGRSAMSKDADEQMLPLMTLTAMVVRAMVGAGIFSIPRNFARATVIHGALIAWAIAGAGHADAGVGVSNSRRPEAEIKGDDDIRWLGRHRVRLMPSAHDESGREANTGP